MLCTKQCLKRFKLDYRSRWACITNDRTYFSYLKSSWPFPHNWKFVWIRYKDQESQVQWASLEHINRTYAYDGTTEVKGQVSSSEAQECWKARPWDRTGKKSGHKYIGSKSRENQEPGSIELSLGKIVK